MKKNCNVQNNLQKHWKQPEILKIPCKNNENKL